MKDRKRLTGEIQSKEIVMGKKRRDRDGTERERQRWREIWTKQPHTSLPHDVTKAHRAAMMYMICWRGLSSNHRGLAVLTRESLNPSSHTSS